MCNCKEGFAVNQAGSKCEPKKKKNTKPDGKNVKSDEQEAKKEAKGEDGVSPEEVLKDLQMKNATLALQIRKSRICFQEYLQI